MHNAIRGVYGSGTDAHTYLDKFLHFNFSLEQPTSRQLQPFIDAEFSKYQMDRVPQADEFLEGLNSLADVFSITPRQIGRAIPLLALATPFSSGGILLAELVVLKICRPDILDKVVLNDRSVHVDLAALFNMQIGRNKLQRINSDNLEFYVTMHNALSGNGEDEYAKKLKDEYGLSVQKVRKDLLDVSKLMNIMKR